MKFKKKKVLTDKKLTYLLIIYLFIHITSCNERADKRTFEKNSSRNAVIMAGGDLVCGNYVESAIKKYGPEHPFIKIKEHIEYADISFANLECVISDKGEKRRKKINYGATPVSLESVLYSGIDVLSIANNHVYDMGEQGLNRMIELLDDSPIYQGGSGKDSESAGKPVIVQVNGLKLAFLFYNSTGFQFCAGGKTAGYNCLDYEKYDNYIGKLLNDMGEIKDADVKIISFHWGDNYKSTPTDAQIKFAHTAIDIGIDAILGHSSHIFHGIEIYKNKPVLYDMGDLLVDKYDDWDTRSFLYYLTFSEKGFSKIELIPVYMPNSQIRIAEGILSDEIITRMDSLSGTFGTEFIKENGKMTLEINKK